MRKMQGPKRIGLALTNSFAYYRGVLRGIRIFAETRPHWLFTSVVPDEIPVQSAGRLRLDGLVASVNTESLARACTRWRRPLVNVSAVQPGLPFPRVGADNHSIGKLAAEHFLERGLRHFGFVGHPRWLFSVEREEGFRHAITEAGYETASFHDTAQGPFDPFGQHWPLNRRVQRWLQRLPKPVGVFAPSDLWGLTLTETCRQVDLRVPEEVALLGVDNDDLHCELARPPLSSIVLPSERIGMEAASVLDRMLSGKRAPTKPILLLPHGVMVRGSSDVLAIDDAEVVAAARFISSHGHEPLRVADVLKQVPVARRSLERRFRKELGRGISKEIRRVHMDRAKRLLTETDLPIALVATQSGFSAFRQMAVVIRQETGQSPTAYRRSMRGFH